MDEREGALEGLVNNKAMDLSFYKNKKVFITGHTGFKGTWLCRILFQAGAEVTGYALEPPTNPSLFELTNTSGRMTSVTGDVRSPQSLADAMRSAEPAIVLHLAAQPLVRLSYKYPALTYETNIMGTVNFFEAVRVTPSVRSCVNITTDKVYKNNEWVWSYRENDELCGYDPYSSSKSASELVTTGYKKSFFSKEDSPAVSTARGGNVIGGGDYSADRVIPDCIRAVADDKEIIIRNPSSIRPYQHVLECLAGYLLLAQRQYADRALAGSYNFGPNDESCVTTGELAEMFCRHWGPRARWKAHSDGGPHEANFLKLDCSKAKSMLGWTPMWNIDTAVQKTVLLAKALQNGADAGDAVDMQIREYFGIAS